MMRRHVASPTFRALMRAVIQAADPGPWRYTGGRQAFGGIMGPHDQITKELVGALMIDKTADNLIAESVRRGNGAFMAVFSPPTVAEMLDYISELEKDRTDAWREIGVLQAKIDELRSGADIPF